MCFYPLEYHQLLFLMENQIISLQYLCRPLGVNISNDVIHILVLKEIKMNRVNVNNFNTPLTI